MIVFARYEADREKHIINSINGDVIQSISFIQLPDGRRDVIKEWTQRLEDLGFKSVDKYANVLIKRGFKEVKQLESRGSGSI